MFEMTVDTLCAIPPTDFATERIWERRDLQRILRDNITAIDDNLLVIAEEFGDFEGSDRRITDHPIHDDNVTWLISNAWGRQTITTLDQLLKLAPNQQFGYRAAP